MLSMAARGLFLVDKGCKVIFFARISRLLTVKAPSRVSVWWIWCIDQEISEIDAAFNNSFQQIKHWSKQLTMTLLTIRNLLSSIVHLTSKLDLPWFCVFSHANISVRPAWKCSCHACGQHMLILFWKRGLYYSRMNAHACIPTSAKTLA